MAKTNAERQAAYRERRKAGQLTLQARLSAIEVQVEALERRVRDLEGMTTANIAAPVEILVDSDALADLRVAEVTKPPIPMPEVEEP